MGQTMRRRGYKKTHATCPFCKHNGCLTIYDDWSYFCFSCEKKGSNFKLEAETNLSADAIRSMETSTPSRPSKPVDVGAGVLGPLLDRNISMETAKHFGVRSLVDSEGKVTNHYYPYYIANEAVAHKVRRVSDKGFYWVGSPVGTLLFGQQVASSGGKFITLTEGECDAMAAYELLGSKWPVVSIKSGATGAVQDIKDNLEFIQSYQNVVIAFDADKAGQDAARKVARLLKPGTAKIMKLPEGCKDPNDMLRQRKHEQFSRCFWNAKTYTPSGVINITDERQAFKHREEKESIPYPWEGLNKKLYGMRQGELITLTGGTGLGKSSVTRELEHWLIKNTNDNVGIIALEESKLRTIDALLSIEANARLYIKEVREQYTDEQLDGFFDILYDGDNENRVWAYSHLGMNDIDAVFAKLRFMIVGCGCKWIVLDHLHMLVSSLAEGDERRGIDNMMTRLRSLVEETGAGLILVSHLRRPEGNRGHENGVETALAHLRGSQSIAQLSDCVISLERNQQSEDPIEANTTKLRILKSRYTGDVGLAGMLLYDRETGRLTEVDMGDQGSSDDQGGDF